MSSAWHRAGAETPHLPPMFPHSPPTQHRLPAVSHLRACVGQEGRQRGWGRGTPGREAGRKGSRLKSKEEMVRR